MAQPAGWKCLLSTPEAWLISAASQTAACISRPRHAGWNMAPNTCFGFLYLCGSALQNWPQCTCRDSVKLSAWFPKPTVCKPRTDTGEDQAKCIVRTGVSHYLEEVDKLGRTPRVNRNEAHWIYTDCRGLSALRHDTHTQDFTVEEMRVEWVLLCSEVSDLTILNLFLSML